jgi:RimK family alpha-L-glutamate ligase
VCGLGTVRYYIEMRVLILSARPDLEVNQRLKNAGRDRGVDVIIEDGARLVAVNNPDLKLLGGTVDVSRLLPDGALARVGNWRPETMLAALEVLEALKIQTPNPAPAIRRGRDHWLTIRALSDSGLSVPQTLSGAEPEALAWGVLETMGFPVVVKQRRSRQGVGVIRCDAKDYLEAVLDSMWRVGDEVVVQQFVECRGISHRLLVAGDRVVAAARFQAGAGEWRSNAARGGTATGHEPDERERRLAVAASQALGLGICGVDILPTPDGFVVCEVNPSPGFTHLEKATGIDVAGSIIEHVVGRSSRP